MSSFHVKFVQTDRWTDTHTKVKQYAPDLSKNEIEHVSSTKIVSSKNPD